MEYVLVSTEKYIFFNPEIPGFGLYKSMDSGLRKTSGTPGPRDPGIRDPGITIPSLKSLISVLEL